MFNLFSSQKGAGAEMPTDDEGRQRMVAKGHDPNLPANHPVNALSPIRKMIILLVLSFSGLLSNFVIAVILVAFPPMGVEFGVPTAKVPDTIGYHLLGMAFGPLFWNALSKSIGRRPVYLLASFIFLPCCVWQALATDFKTFSVARVLCGLTGSFSQTVPPATIADIFRADVRGTKMSVFGVALVIAPTISPLFGSAIMLKGTWHHLFWFVLGLGGLQFLLYLVFVPETLWVEDSPAAPTYEPQTPDSIADEKSQAAVHTEFSDADVEGGQATRAAHFRSGHVGSAWLPWKQPGHFLKVFFNPIWMVRYIAISLPSFYYGMLWAWSVFITVMQAHVFEAPPYHFGMIAFGCTFLFLTAGGVLGKWSGGIVGDKTIAYFEKRKGQRQPEDRLWAALPIFPLMLVSLVVCGFAIQNKMHWAVLPILSGLFYYALSASTGILSTYVLETYVSQAMDTQAVFMFWKMLWGFAQAFFAHNWANKQGFVPTLAIMGALCTGGGFLVVGLLLWKGAAIRRAQGMPAFEK